jgi:hypothetical protein
LSAAANGHGDAVSTVATSTKARKTHIGQWALILGLLSAILLLLGFGWLPFGFPLGTLLAIVAVGLGIAALLRGETRPAALAGVVLGLLTVFAALFLILSIAFAPGD